MCCLNFKKIVGGLHSLIYIYIYIYIYTHSDYTAYTISFNLYIARYTAYTTLLDLYVDLQKIHSLLLNSIPEYIHQTFITDS